MMSVREKLAPPPRHNCIKNLRGLKIQNLLQFQQGEHNNINNAFEHNNRPRCQKSNLSSFTIASLIQRIKEILIGNKNHQLPKNKPLQQERLIIPQKYTSNSLQRHPTWRSLLEEVQSFYAKAEIVLVEWRCSGKPVSQRVYDSIYIEEIKGKRR